MLERTQHLLDGIGLEPSDFFRVSDFQRLFSISTPFVGVLFQLIQSAGVIFFRNVQIFHIGLPALQRRYEAGRARLGPVPS